MTTMMNEQERAQAAMMDIKRRAAGLPPIQAAAPIAPAERPGPAAGMDQVFREHREHIQAHFAQQRDQEEAYFQQQLAQRTAKYAELSSKVQAAAAALESARGDLAAAQQRAAQHKQRGPGADIHGWAQRSKATQSLSSSASRRSVRRRACYAAQSMRRGSGGLLS